MLIESQIRAGSDDDLDDEQTAVVLDNGSGG